MYRWWSNYYIVWKQCQLTYSIKGHLIFKGKNCRRWAWCHVDKFKKHFRTNLHVEMIWYGQCDHIFFTITYQEWHILTSGLAKNCSKKQTMCSYPLFLASSTRDTRCSRHTAIIITNDICLATKSHTPSFLSAVLTAAFVTSTSIRSMHSCRCLGFKCCCVGRKTWNFVKVHFLFTCKLTRVAELATELLST